MIASISSRSAAGQKSMLASPHSSKALLNMRRISDDSLLTIVPRSLSHSTGTDARVVQDGSAA